MATETLRLKVTLRGSEPEIWRQVEVVSTTTLAHLHRALQTAMGWTDSHLHQFWYGQRCFGVTDPELGLDCEDERRMRIGTLLRQPGDHVMYEYDFGDGWEHDITLEGVGPVTGDEPRVCNGCGACPPEDVGGIPGFEEFLRALANSQHPRHREFLDWHGPFEPGAFNLEATNGALRIRGRMRTDA